MYERPRLGVEAWDTPGGCRRSSPFLSATITVCSLCASFLAGCCGHPAPGTPKLACDGSGVIGALSRRDTVSMVPAGPGGSNTADGTVAAPTLSPPTPLKALPCDTQRASPLSVSVRAPQEQGQGPGRRGPRRTCCLRQEVLESRQPETVADNAGFIETARIRKQK